MSTSLRTLPRPCLAALLAVLGAGPARAQLVGENINMVTGTQWPGGDPFLQRQNEPSLAVSSANPDHLVAGANDYRTVDLPGPTGGEPNGDAWVGLFKSFDGGLTWQSLLLPGYPQDTSAAGLASPIHGFTAAADAGVRPGTDGLIYYSGIAFNRATDLGAVFVARLVDDNNKENGDATQGRDPIRYLGAAVVASATAGQFQDKPWIAADVPRAGAGTCTIPGNPARTIAAGTVYLAYATFTGSKEGGSKIYVNRSLDCGATWQKPIKVSESSSLNQGTTLAIDPVSGAVWLAWRRFATSSNTDAIMISTSTDGGQTFTKGTVVANITPFDQEDSPTMFRTDSLPSIAISVDAAGVRFVHLAWAERRNGPTSDARIVLSTLSGGTWSTPRPIDDAPILDEQGIGFTRGHQLMPQLTFSQGKLMALYYDSRLTHTRAYYAPRQPFAPDPVTGAFYSEWRGPLGELPGQPELVYSDELDDAGLTQLRHTLDVRVATAAPGAVPNFSSTRVSRFPFGTRGDEVNGQQAASFSGPPLQVVDGAGQVQLLQQLQSNPPNLPMFSKGTLPFMGDYIDIAGPTFVRTATGWAFATAASAAPVHHAIWTSNQDVRPPADGDWTHYTPVGAAGPSLYDPTQPRSACVPGNEGSRNQNIYTARITSGLAVSTPQNVKPLSATVTRAFVSSIANSTDRVVAVRLTASPPAGVAASFRNDGVGLQALEVLVPPRSAVSRSLFVVLAGSSNPLATLPVRVEEIDASSGCAGSSPPTCPLVPGGLGGSITFNPPGATAVLVQPDGSPDDVTRGETYTPALALANVTSANVTSANVTSANVTSANVTSANVTSANVTSTHIANPDLANVTSANVTSANVTSANVTSANVTSKAVASANVTSANVTSAAISDANYTLTNTGNTSHSFHIQVVGTTGSGPLQLIVSKPSYTPIAINCVLLQQPQNAVVLNVDDVSQAILPPGSNLLDANIPDPRTTNATVELAPGETAQITLRGAMATAAMVGLTGQLTPVAVPHGGGAFAAGLIVTSDGASLPVPRVGVPYSGALQALGGQAPYAWSLASGALPAGLALSAAGALTGTPTAAGPATFTVQVTDAAGHTAARSLTLAVQRGPTTTALAVTPAASVSGQPVTLTATVAATDPLAPAPTGSVTFTDGAATLGSAPLSGGVASLTTTTLAVGSHPLQATYPGDARYLGSTSATATATVALPPQYTFTGFLSPLSTAGTLAAPTSSPPQNLGSAVPLKWTLQDANGTFLTSLSTTRRISALQNPACSGPPPAGAASVLLYSPTSGATGKSTFRVSSGTQFTFNWDTSSAAKGCYTVVLELDDGSTPRATTVKLQ